MSYSALFTSGLSLASQPRTESDSYKASKPPSLQITIHPGTPARPRMRKRRSSLTIATSPISTIKSPARSANESLRAALRSPREGTFLESLQNGTRPKTVRRQTLSSIKDLPSFPAPTSPLPTLPSMRIDLPRTTFTSSAPITPTDEAYPSSPITSEPHFSNPNASLRTSNPSRKSSTLLPPFLRSRSSSGSGRGPLSPSPYAGNMRDSTPVKDLDMGMVAEEKEAPATAWFDDDEDMKENDVDMTR